MLPTRDFWFQRPVEWDEQWAEVLHEYQKSDMWPEVPLPQKEDLLHTLLHTKDSAPSPDGLPYSAWRLLPEVTVDAMTSYFILQSTTPVLLCTTKYYTPVRLPTATTYASTTPYFTTYH